MMAHARQREGGAPKGYEFRVQQVALPWGSEAASPSNRGTSASEKPSAPAWRMKLRPSSCDSWNEGRLDLVDGKIGRGR